MRRVLTTVLAVALLLGLGALAVLALPGANASLAGAPPVSAAAPVFEPDAPAATLNYNAIALPLDSSAQFTYNSQGLATLIGSSVKKVLRLDPVRQAFDTWDPVLQEGSVGGNYVDVPWAVETGEVYWVQVDSSSPPVVSFVGGVPAANTIDFTFVGSSPTCSYNAISIPLEQSAIVNTQQLAVSIGVSNVTKILRLDAGRQAFDTWDPVLQEGSVGGNYVDVPWEVKIGYPYWVCVASSGNAQVWP